MFCFFAVGSKLECRSDVKDKGGVRGGIRGIFYSVWIRSAIGLRIFMRSSYNLKQKPRIIRGFCFKLCWLTIFDQIYLQME